MSNFPHRHRSIWLILVALIHLILIPVAIWQASEKGDENTAIITAEKPPMPSSSSRSSGNHSQRSALPDLPPSHTTDELASFQIPQSTLENVMLDEALETLLGEYRRICRQTGEGPVPFQWFIEGNAEPIAFLNLSGDLLSNLSLIAAMSGTELEIEGDQLTFREVEDGEITTRQWTVPPNFEVFLATSLRATSNANDQGELDKSLRRLGLINETDTVSYLPKTSTLTVKSCQKRGCP